MTIEESQNMDWEDTMVAVHSDALEFIVSSIWTYESLFTFVICFEGSRGRKWKATAGDGLRYALPRMSGISQQPGGRQISYNAMQPFRKCSAL